MPSYCLRQFERRLIGQRTKDALAVKKREGVKLGRPVIVDQVIAKRIVRETWSGSLASGHRRQAERGRGQHSSR